MATFGRDTKAALVDKDVKLKTNFAAEATAEFIVEKPLLAVGHHLAP